MRDTMTAHTETRVLPYPAEFLFELVADVEPLELERLGIANPYLSLWIVSDSIPEE